MPNKSAATGKSSFMAILGLTWDASDMPATARIVIGAKMKNDLLVEKNNDQTFKR